MTEFFDEVMAAVADASEVTEDIAMAAARVAYMRGYQDACDGEPPRDIEP